MQQTFLVTGAGRDIGRGIAEHLGRTGAFGVLHYASSADGAEEALSTIRAHGGDGVAVRADLSSPGGVRDLSAATLDALGNRPLQALVLGAAVTEPSLEDSIDPEAVARMFRVNAIAPIQLVDLLAERFVDGTSIVAITVADHSVFSPDFAAFAASKAALRSMVPAWARRYGGRGVRANAIAPGVVDVNFRADLLRDDAFRAQLVEDTALGRPGAVEDVVNVVDFLVSRRAQWVTGQTIDASGGWKL